MNIFNSLGSNYNLAFALKALFSQSRQKHSQKLKHYLACRYQGRVFLSYKGREALYLALKALKIPRGCFVAITGYTCFAVYQAVCHAGLKPEYLDIDADLNFSPHALLKALKNNPKIKAVIIQNTLGFPAQADKLKKICQRRGIFLIEDLAHCVASKYLSGQLAGKIGDAVVFSFSQDKLLDAVSGGAVVVRNKKYRQFKPEKSQQVSPIVQLRDRFYPLLTYLIRLTYPIFIGKLLHSFLKLLNLLSRPMAEKSKLVVRRLPDWYANLALDAFKKIDQNLEHRREITKIYSSCIDPQLYKHMLHVWPEFVVRFPILVNRRPSLISFLKKHSIYVSDIWYDAPIAPKRFLQQTDYQHQCPLAEKISATMLNLPTHRNVSAEKARQISNLVNQWLKQ